MGNRIVWGVNLLKGNDSSDRGCRGRRETCPRLSGQGWCFSDMWIVFRGPNIRPKSFGFGMRWRARWTDQIVERLSCFGHQIRRIRLLFFFENGLLLIELEGFYTAPFAATLTRLFAFSVIPSDMAVCFHCLHLGFEVQVRSGYVCF